MLGSNTDNLSDPNCLDLTLIFIWVILWGSASPTSLITMLVRKFTTKSSGQYFVAI